MFICENELSSTAVSTPELISEAAARVGSQSIVVVMDVKKTGLISGCYEIFTHNGTQSTGLYPVDFAKHVEALGAGEVVVNSIDRDGADCVHCVQRSLRAVCSVNGEGGAGTVKDIAALIDSFSIIGAAAGSLFVFKGKYRAVLINYPNRADKDALVSQALVPR